jgi:hypothetical protein
MIKLIDLLNENLDIDKLFNDLKNKLEQKSKSTVGLEREFSDAKDPITKLKVINKYKKLL